MMNVHILLLFMVVLMLGGCASLEGYGSVDSLARFKNGGVLIGSSVSSNGQNVTLSNRTIILTKFLPNSQYSLSISSIANNSKTTGALSLNSIVNTTSSETVIGNTKFQLNSGGVTDNSNFNLSNIIGLSFYQDTATNGSIRGLYGIQQYLSVGNYQGVYNNPTNGYVRNAYGYWQEFMSGTTTFTVNNYYGFYMTTTGYGDAQPIVNNYTGIYLENITATDKAYSIYTNKGVSRFGDKMNVTDSIQSTNITLMNQTRGMYCIKVDNASLIAVNGMC